MWNFNSFNQWLNPPSETNLYQNYIFFAEIEKINSVHFLGLYLSSCNELQELSVAAADGCSSMIGESGHHHCHH